MTGVSPQPVSPSPARLARVLGLVCGLSLAVALSGGPVSLPGQEEAASSFGARTPWVSPDRMSATRLLYSDDGPGLEGELREAASLSFTLPAGHGAGAWSARAPLFREVSMLERGWRLVGKAASRGSADLEEMAWASNEGGGSDEPADPPFLVELFDARELMAWIREAKDWGMDARRTLFGPRGIVRAGSVPGSDRPRLRLELTDSRPGFQFVILTR